MLPYAIEATSKLSEGFKTGGLSGMLAAAGAIISDLGSKLKTKAEELLPNAINGVVDTINGLFGLNLPKIEKIDLPTWDELKESFTNWWEGLGEEGGILKNLKGILSWGLGALDKMPTLPEIITSVSTWWTETAYPAIADIFGWSLDGNPEPPSVSDVINTITKWWDELVTPLLSGIFSWALGEDVNFPELATVIDKITKWWNETVLPGMTKLFVDIFGVDPPDISQAVKDIRKWWEDVKVQLGTLFFPVKPTGVYVDDSGAQHTVGSGGRFATGLDYVPYNEFPARLHEGEAVLTKLEAENWRNGRGAAGAGEIVTVNVNLDNVSIRDERDIETLAQQIAQYTRRQNYGMGAVAY